MNNSLILDKVLSVIDENILLDHDEIVKKIYIETKYTDQDFNKFLAVITVGKLTLGKYIRERRLYFAVQEMMNHPEKALVDIALDYGYSEQSAFTRAVSRTYRKPPAELKKSKQIIPDNRKDLENCLSDKSRLGSVLESIMGKLSGRRIAILNLLSKLQRRWDLICQPAASYQNCQKSWTSHLPDF